MKTLLSVALLAAITACSMQNPSVSNVAKNANNVRTNSEKLSKSDENAAKKYGYDKPLFVDLKQFQEVAREKLTARFGKLAEKGQIIQRDRAGIAGPTTFYDQNRLYYIVEATIDPRLFTQGEEGESYKLYAAYMIGTNGVEGVGYAETLDSTPNYLEWKFGSAYLSFNKSYQVRDEEGGIDIAATREKMDALAAQYREKYPNLSYYGSWSVPAVMVDVVEERRFNPSQADIEAINAMIQEAISNPDVVRIEISSEARNAQPGPLVKLGDGESQKTIDMNALRTVTRQFLDNGNTPLENLPPHLPAPFNQTPSK